MCIRSGAPVEAGEGKMNAIHRQLQDGVTVQRNGAQSLYTACYQMNEETAQSSENWRRRHGSLSPPTSGLEFVFLFGLAITFNCNLHVWVKWCHNTI